MKTLLFVVIIMTNAIIAFGQQQQFASVGPVKDISGPLSDIAAVSTPQKDTLFVPNDSLGASIRWIWTNRPIKGVKSPVIISCDEIALRKKFILYNKEEDKYSYNK